jgi:hypothetical protein
MGSDGWGLRWEGFKKNETDVNSGAVRPKLPLRPYSTGQMIFCEYAR